MSSNKHHREANAALDNLVERFPAAFALSDRKPLKLGIRDDLLARGVARRSRPPGCACTAGAAATSKQ